MEKLKITCRDHKKLLHICDEKEENFKEDHTILRTQLEDAKRNKKVMCNKKKEKNDYVEALENVVENLRRQLEEKDQQLEKFKRSIAEKNLALTFKEEMQVRM